MSRGVFQRAASTTYSLKAICCAHCGSDLADPANFLFYPLSFPIPKSVLLRITRLVVGIFILIGLWVALIRWLL